MLNLGPQQASDDYQAMVARGKHLIRTASDADLAQELRVPTTPIAELYKLTEREALARLLTRKEEM